VLSALAMPPSVSVPLTVYVVFVSTEPSPEITATERLPAAVGDVTPGATV
jgi:hypothetical protein